MFRSIKDFLVRIKVGGLVHSALEHSPLKLTNSQADLSAIAHRLVSEAWDANPQVFNGTSAERPHNLCIAAMVLNVAVAKAADINLAICYNSALFAVLHTIQRDSVLLSLSPINKMIIDECKKAASEFTSSPAFTSMIGE